ncbi:hypothetical protein [Mesorhizobium ciceri]|uniref:hypothetical protein n=1 Tax=Mesorhizobium TaxID=68287 RepID=UPI0004788DB8|nr:hypothetical protein [Mesorhizobium ciceri]
MRMLTIAVALSGAVIIQPVHTQTLGPQLPPVTPQDEAQPELAPPDPGSSDLNFTGVAIVAVEDLPDEIKAQADAVIDQTSAEDLLRLQNSVDASPQATSALRANGLNSSQVVAANIDGDGTLTLIIQTTT